MNYPGKFTLPNIKKLFVSFVITLFTCQHYMYPVWCTCLDRHTPLQDNYSMCSYHELLHHTNHTTGTGLMGSMLYDYSPDLKSKINHWLLFVLSYMYVLIYQFSVPNTYSS